MERAVGFKPTQCQDGIIRLTWWMPSRSYALSNPSTVANSAVRKHTALDTLRLHFLA